METTISFQDIIRRLSRFWEENGCIIHQGYDIEVGAGTMNPATFLRCLGPEPYRAAYVEPCRRPADGRYGENPNRLQHYFQFQVILKPSPLNMQNLYLDSLKAIGIDLSQHDIRFVHDDWENPSIGAWGLGWEVWIDGMEITQFTYFQSVGGLPQKPVTGELTYGLERLAMYLQGVDNVYDVQWNGHLTYRNLYHRQEVEWSTYNFEKATTSMWFDHFDAYEKEATQLLLQDLPIPAYEFVMKASHAFNILDARGAISVTERTGYIARMRDLAKHIADKYLESREKAGFPLMGCFPAAKSKTAAVPRLAEALLHPSRETETFLLEIGSEELPATFVPIGMRNLEKEIRRLLQEEAIAYHALKVYGTPRRLTVLVEGLATTLPEQVKERRGPTLDKAYDTQGQLTPAGRGFFRSLKKEPLSRDALEKGVDPDVTVKYEKNNTYIFGTLHLPAVPTAVILAEKLPSLILAIHFPKTMHWAEETIAYARPLRWICALFGKEIIPFVIGDVVSGSHSFGHRQLDNTQQFSISSAENYVPLLRQHFVMVDPEERKKTIVDSLQAWEKTTHCHVHTEALKEVVHLVEWPQILEATFAPAFLKAPKEVLISEMVTHQKYFPVKGEDGTLTPHFLIVTDTTPTEKIRHGNQKVLSSRLADGVFLYEKELRTPLPNFLEKLKHVTYLTGFGSLYDKVERLKKHVSTLQTFLGISTQAQAMHAAEWSKADLATEMVAEFPELQGTIGKYYALANREETEIAQAIEEHWMPRGEDAPLPETETGKLLSLAEKIDNLISCFGAGLQPTSSSDPYALRRQVLGMIKILIEGKYRLPFQETFIQCASHFATLKNPQSVLKEIEAFFIQRMKTVFQDYGLHQDEVEASVAHGFIDIYDTFCKINALHAFRASSDQKFVQLYEVYKRAKGQLNQEERRNHFSPALLCEDAEKQLDAALTNIEKNMYQALKGHHYNQAYQLIADMQPFLAKLFDEVRILADDLQLRHNRIALLQRVFALFSQLLDFSKISERSPLIASKSEVKR